LSTLRATWPVLHNPANRHRAVSLTPGQFHYAFTNTLSAAQSAQVYQRYQVPGPGHVLFEGALANLDAHSALRVDYDNNERAPLLFIAGGADHLVPAPVNRANATLHRRSRALTGYREFPGRSHYTLGQDGWEELADYAVDWATKNATRTRSGDDHEPPAASR
jgi:pimeloyl-ACP methyl ester carboxylesterase